jgi:protein TonB
MKPILYRPSSRWPLLSAFAAAAAIHVSALAFSPQHRAEIMGPGLVPVEIDPAMPEPQPTPEPEQTEPPAMTLPPAESNEFFEPPRPTPRHMTKLARPIHSNSGPNITKPPVGNGKVYALSAPLPNYPYEARAHHVTGSGEAVLEVDPTTGSVLNARMTESTGSLILDNSAINAFRRWRFRNGTPSTVRIPFTFTMAGARL